MKEQPREHQIADVEKEQSELTVDRAVKLLFLSFRFSQGSPGFQGDIFNYFKVQHPSWEISKEVEEEVRQRAFPVFKKFFASPGVRHAGVGKEEKPQYANTKEEEIAEQVTSEVANMAQALSRKPFEKAFVMEHLLEDLLRKEEKYSVTPRPGRDKEAWRSRDKQAKYKPKDDPYFSFLCYYGFLGNSTGDPLYDKMFKDIVSTIKEPSITVNDKQVLAGRVVRRWNKRHSNMQVDMDNVVTQR